jgi:hypothetical protein
MEQSVTINIWFLMPCSWLVEQGDFSSRKAVVDFMGSIMQYAFIVQVGPDAQPTFQDSVTLYRFKQDEAYVTTRGNQSNRASVTIEAIGVSNSPAFIVHLITCSFLMSPTMIARYAVVMCGCF